MSWKWNAIWLLLVLLPTSYQKPNRDPKSYVAAVVNFSPKHVKGNSRLTFKENVDKFVGIIRKARLQDADIIVFPEYALTSVHLPPKEKMYNWTTLIPYAWENYNPCTQDNVNVSVSMKKLSCAAKENKIYLVINIPEKGYPCDARIDKKCRDKKLQYYNTNVVFDRTGTIVARYRKTHLYLEPQFDVMETPEVVSFDTDFGVTFGIFTCFDILFYEPPLNLTRAHGITDFILPTTWSSEVPFLTGLQLPFGWAFGENVNLLTAGTNEPKEGNTGSGIILGRKGIANGIMTDITGNRLLISRVPIMKKNHSAPQKKESKMSMNYENRITTMKGEDAGDRITMLHDNFTFYKSLPFKHAISKILCHGSICCSFEIRTKSFDSTTKYRIVAYDGLRDYKIGPVLALSVCALVQCSGDSITSCGSIRNSETTFTTLDISGVFRQRKNILVFPTVIDSSVLPFGDWNYNEVPHNNHTHISMSLEKPTKNLVTFGIYARIPYLDVHKSQQ